MSEMRFADYVGLVGFAGVAFEHWLGGTVVFVLSLLLATVAEGSKAP